MEDRSLILERECDLLAGGRRELGHVELDVGRDDVGAPGCTARSGATRASLDDREGAEHLSRVEVALEVVLTGSRCRKRQCFLRPSIEKLAARRLAQELSPF